jgi:hypothetical protein
MGQQIMAERFVYQILRFEVSSQEQQALFLNRITIAIPELNGLGVEPVGVFTATQNSLSQVIVVLPRSEEGSLTSASADAWLLADEPLGAEPLYHTYSSSLYRAFDGFPDIHKPTQNANRVFQLRTYESPGVTEHEKKVEMFQSSEIAIFERVGLNPVFFAQAIADTDMPNLTYMLAFDDLASLKTAWQTFVADEEWQQLSALPEYADELLIRNISNSLLHPCACSQL